MAGAGCSSCSIIPQEGRVRERALLPPRGGLRGAVSVCVPSPASRPLTDFSHTRMKCSRQNRPRGFVVSSAERTRAESLNIKCRGSLSRTAEQLRLSSHLSITNARSWPGLSYPFSHASHNARRAGTFSRNERRSVSSSILSARSINRVYAFSCTARACPSSPHVSRICTQAR